MIINVSCVRFETLKNEEDDCRIKMNKTELEKFDVRHLGMIDQAVELAEELVSNHYKMSANQWLRGRYDVKTLTDLSETEIVQGPFAQIVRYRAQKKDTILGSSSYDFYKICIQDHNILTALSRQPELTFFPFSLYILTHELIHIVRFGKFLQSFDASDEERLAEEIRVHDKTHQILKTEHIPGIKAVLQFYYHWRNSHHNTWD